MIIALIPFFYNKKYPRQSSILPGILFLNYNGLSNLNFFTAHAYALNPFERNQTEQAVFRESA